MGNENDLVSDDLLKAHMDPFYNECRAYGRLRECRLDGKVAVRCHGYIAIPAQVEDQLEQEFEIDDWDRPGEEYDKPFSQTAAESYCERLGCERRPSHRQGCR